MPLLRRRSSAILIASHTWCRLAELAYETSRNTALARMLVFTLELRFSTSYACPAHSVATVLGALCRMTILQMVDAVSPQQVNSVETLAALLATERPLVGMGPLVPAQMIRSRVSLLTDIT
jgi:hypothetical protein